jgi:hypothetical protein
MAISNKFMELIQGILAPGSVGTGRKTVTSAGSAEQFTDTKCSYVIITAESDNTGNVVVGDANVVAAAGSERGIILEPSRSERIYLSNLNLLWLDSAENGDGVSYAYFK